MTKGIRTCEFGPNYRSVPKRGERWFTRNHHLVFISAVDLSRKKPVIGIIEGETRTRSWQLSGCALVSGYPSPEDLSKKFLFGLSEEAQVIVDRHVRDAILDMAERMDDERANYDFLAEQVEVIRLNAIVAQHWFDEDAEAEQPE